MPVVDPRKSLLALALEWYAKVNVIVASGTGRVKLPQTLSGNVVLSIEPNNPQNNQSLSFTKKGFSCVMSFNRAPFSVFVPFEAVLAIITDDYQVTFPEEREAPQPATEHEDDPIMKPRAKLRGIDGGKK